MLLSVKLGPPIMCHEQNHYFLHSIVVVTIQELLTPCQTVVAVAVAVEVAVAVAVVVAVAVEMTRTTVRTFLRAVVIVTGR